MAAGPPTKISPVRLFLIPALWVLIVPVFGYGFSSHYLEQWSEGTRAAIRRETPEGEKAADPEHFEAQLAAFDLGAMAWDTCGPFGFFETPAGVEPSFCHQLLQFEWVRWIAKGLLGLSLLTGGALAGLLVWASRAARRQHLAFRWGWSALRAFGIPHIVGQGLIVLFLSFWMTALWFESYSVKLVGAVAILGIYAIFVAIRALFQRGLQRPREHGRLLTASEAPAFFELVRALAEKLRTAPPENVVLGIDDNFFVTESDLEIFETYPSSTNPDPKTTRLEGRTLYASLSLMRVLHLDETRAVLAHELGHFALGDTQQSRALNPLLQRFAGYVQSLEQATSFGVVSFMRAFRVAFELTSRKHGRAAEFAADGVARELVGAGPAAGALVRVAAYSTYRDRTEASLIESMQKHGELNIRDRVRSGFAEFVAIPQTREQLLEKQTPHPFDTHPPLLERLGALGIEPPTAAEIERLSAPVSSNALEAIPAADALEAQLWAAYEDDFQAKHDRIIAHRLTPKSADEVAHVERHFPTVRIPTRDGPEVVLSWRGVVLADGVEIDFEDLAGAERTEETLKGDCLLLKTALSKHKVVLSRFQDKGALFVATLERYWNRHMMAVASAAAVAEADPDGPSSGPGA